MNHSDIAALMRGVAPAIRDMVTATVKPLADRIIELEAELERARAVDPAEMIRVAVADAVAALPSPAPGRDADPEVIQQMVADAVAALPPAKDGEAGKDADPESVEALVLAAVADAVASIPPAPAGKDADPEEIARMVADAVGALPPAAPGKDADPELIREMVQEAVSALPAPEPGKDGSPGKLPIVRAWSDTVHYEGDVVVFEGSSYQAVRDTGRPPSHEDWQCIARAGERGQDGRSFTVRGTWSETAEYAALDVVALGGAGFVARRDNPGACPGEGWQLIAAQGKRGSPGEPGKTVKGDRGDDGLPVVEAHVDDEGVLILTNGDGSTVRCDFYPVLSRLA